MIQPRLVWELARKDLMLFAADRRGMVLCLAIPILLASTFGAIFHRSSDEPMRPSVLIVTADRGALTSQIVATMCEHPQIRAQRSDRTTAYRRLASESDAVVVILPETLSQLSLTHLKDKSDRPRVELLHHPRSQYEARWVEGVLTEVILRESAQAMLAPVLGGKPLIDRPFTVERRAEPAGGALAENAFSHSFCGMTLQYLLFWGMDSGLLLLRERRQGIWRRLRAAPITWMTLITGKALATAMIALLQIGITFGFGMVVFGVTITGSLLGFVLMALTASGLSAATGLLVAALGGNEVRARPIAILVILTLSLLGGLWLPSFLLPAWAQRLALALPTTWAARGLEGVTWQGMSFSGAWPCAVILSAFSAAFLALAWWRLTRSEGEASCSA